MSIRVINTPGEIIGTSYWQIGVDGVLAKCPVSITPHDRVAKIFKGITESEDKSTLTDWTSTLSYFSYGGPTDKWGMTLTPAIVNGADFGFSIAVCTALTYYCGELNGNHDSSGKLELKNLGLNIPLTATIDGVKVEVNQKYESSFAIINDVRITVYYTGGEVSTNMRIDIGNSWKVVNEIKIKVGGVWKPVISVKQKIGGVWKTIF